MKPQQLKNSILQLAIEGRLVPQRADEGTAEELYKNVQAEKKALVKSGKLKKDKPFAAVKPEEAPFAIPASWKWVRLDMIGEACLGKMLDRQRNEGVNARYLRNVNVRWGDFDLSDVYEMKFEDVNNERFLVRKGDLVVCEGGEPGRCAIWNDDEPIHFQKALHRIRFNRCAHVKFFYYVFSFYAAQNIFSKHYTGTTIKHLTGQSLGRVYFPLPPLAEQRRIVEKLEEVLPLIDRYGAAWERLEELNSRFPDEMKKSLLQEAVEGRLVPQRADEGTAEELYKNVQAEKKALVKSGKLKKDKPFAAVKPEDAPFAIPASWKWVRLGEVVFNHGQTMPQEMFSYIDIGSIDNKRQCLSDGENLVEPKSAPSRARKIVTLGDILYSTVRPYLHNMCIIDKTFSHVPIASTGFAVLACHEGIDNRYLFNCLRSPFFDAYANDSENAKGVAYPVINDARLYKAPIPLPPLAEQRRIVEKLEVLLPLVDRLR